MIGTEISSRLIPSTSSIFKFNLKKMNKLYNLLINNVIIKKIVVAWLEIMSLSEER